MYFVASFDPMQCHRPREPVSTMMFKKSVIFNNCLMLESVQFTPGYTRRRSDTSSLQSVQLTSSTAPVIAGIPSHVGIDICLDTICQSFT
jgi:hypothetical protein